MVQYCELWIVLKEGGKPIERVRQRHSDEYVQYFIKATHYS